MVSSSTSHVSWNRSRLTGLHEGSVTSSNAGSAGVMRSRLQTTNGGTRFGTPGEATFGPVTQKARRLI